MNTHKKPRTIAKVLAITMALHASLTAQTTQRMPTGTINPIGDIGPKETPEFQLTLSLPGIATDVFDLTNNASLEIKQDSIFKIQALGVGLSERNDQTRARVFLNGKSHLFYLGSQHNLENKNDDDPSEGKKTDWFWAPNSTYDNLVDLAEYTMHNTSTTKPKRKDRISDFGKVVDFSLVPEADRTLYLKKGDDIEIITEFWGGLYHIASSKDQNQTQMRSFFDGDVIPTAGVNLDQPDFLEMLQNGYGEGSLIRKREDGVYVANLRKDQMVTMVDYRSTGKDLNDLVYMVEVSNGYNDFKVFLVKMDLSLPEVAFQDGEVLTDDNGNYIDKNGDIIEQTVDYQDEMIEVNPQVYNQSSPDYDPNKKYKFSSPTGDYGSIYQLVFVPLTNMSFGGSTEDGDNTNDSTTINAGELLVLDERMGDGVEKAYNFALNIVDPTNPNTIANTTEDAPHTDAGNYQTLSDVSYQFNREVLGFTYPSHDPLISKGTYVKLYKEITFVYKDDVTELTYPGTTNQWTYSDDSNIEGFLQKQVTESYLTKSDFTHFTWFLDDPVWNATTNKFVYASETRKGDKADISNSDVFTPLPNNKSGEIHFITYKYHAKRYMDSVSKKIYIKNYELFPEASKSPKENTTRIILKVYAPPTGEFTKVQSDLNNLATLPSYTADIKNIYPNAKVYVRHRNFTGSEMSNTEVSETEVSETDLLHDDAQSSNHEKYPVKPFRLTAQIVSSPNDTIPDYIEDGNMITELVHEISYSATKRNAYQDDDITNDPKPDDVRVLHSFIWTLDRRIDVRGGINTSK